MIEDSIESLEDIQQSSDLHLLISHEVETRDMSPDFKPVTDWLIPFFQPTSNPQALKSVLGQGFRRPVHINLSGINRTANSSVQTWLASSSPQTDSDSGNWTNLECGVQNIYAICCTHDDKVIVSASKDSHTSVLLCYSPAQQDEPIWSHPLTHVSFGVCEIHTRGGHYLIYSLRNRGKLFRLNMDGLGKMKVYSEENSKLTKITSNTNDKLFVVNNNSNPKTIQVLSAKTEPYIWTRTVNTRLTNWIDEISYLSVYNIVVCTSSSASQTSGKVLAIDALSGATRWQLDHMNGSRVRPSGISIETDTKFCYILLISCHTVSLKSRSLEIMSISVDLSTHLQIQNVNFYSFVGHQILNI